MTFRPIDHILSIMFSKISPRLYTLLLFSSIGFVLLPSTSAQINPYQHHTERKRDRSDSTLQNFFRNGELYGHARYYFMATDNARDYQDFFSNAFGMGIAYESAKYKGFQIGLSGFFIQNLWSTDLTILDKKTGVGSRYEIGQFDLLNPKNKHDMDRLEDLYVKYSRKNLMLKFGKQHIRSPFINPQDGRMRPTLVQGLLFEYTTKKNLKIEGGWIYKISPRGTVDWFSVGQSIGIFPAGRDVEGNASQYPGHVHSPGVYYAGFTKVHKGVKLQAWNQTILNINNTSLFQLNSKPKLNQKYNLVLGGQFIAQYTIGHGGNTNPAFAYAQKGSKAKTFGFRAGIERNKTLTWLVNYNRITAEGRYLMPREWGRDPFFTFMPRERNEGNADVHALNSTVTKDFGKGIKAELGYGIFEMPNHPKDNKYNFPSYGQVNADIRYHFKGFFEGLEVQMLYVYKHQTKGNELPGRQVINKVNLSLYNIIFNYHF